MHERPFIGLLANDLVGSYQIGYWTGMKLAARQEDCDLLSLNGGEIGSTDLAKFMRNDAFRLLIPAKVDAIVLLAPVAANTMKPKKVREFVAKFAPIPVVVAGMELHGVPSVLVDNTAGMVSVVEHVLGDHGRKRPVFLGGPLHNPEAAERLAAFRSVRDKHGLPFVPEMEVVGEFDFGIGKERIKQLLDTGLEFDAVIAANDDMALGAMEALKERGRRVPHDVVVTGFDDIEECLFSTPALTSVRQPVLEQGADCLRLALDLVDGKSVPHVTRQKTTLIPRGSCGCYSRSIEDGKLTTPNTWIRGCSEDGPGSSAHLEAAISECSDLDGFDRSNPGLKTLIEALARDAAGGNGLESLRAFHALLDTCSRPDDELDRWQIFISRIRRATAPFLDQGSQEAFALNSLFHQLRILAHERAVQVSAYRSTQIERWTRLLHETGGRLVNCFDVNDLVETLATDLKGLQLASCHIVLRESRDSLESVRVVLSYSNGVRQQLPPSGEVRPLQALLKSLIRDSPLRCALAVEPLFFGKTSLGYMIMELNSRRGMLLDALRSQVSAALMGARLVEQVHSSAGVVVEDRGSATNEFRAASGNPFSR